MTHLLRLATLACATVAALVFSANAFAAFVPRLAVSHGRPNVAGGPADPTIIRVNVPREHDPTARIQILLPAGYEAPLNEAVGTTIGNVDAQANARAISPEAMIALQGPIVTENPASFASNPCAPGMHTAVWTLRLTAAGQTLTIPAYVDRATAAGASFSITICLSSPNVPPAQGGAQFGAKLVDATMTLNRVFRAPARSGESTWVGLFTPYGAGTTVNAAGTVEAQSHVRQPKLLTLDVLIRPGKIVQLSGRLTEGNRAVPNARIQIFRGGRPVGRRAYVFRRYATTPTNARGIFTHRIRFKLRGFHAFQAQVVVPERTASCTGTSRAPGGCVSATVSGFRAQSARTRLLRVTP